MRRAFRNIIAISVAACSYGCGSYKVTVLKDISPSQLTNQRAHEADQSAVQHIVGTYMYRGSSVSISFFTGSEVGGGPPRSRLELRSSGSLTPLKAHAADAKTVSDIKEFFDKVETEPGIKKASRVIEDLYFILQKLGSGQNEVIYISDLEQWTPGGLTASQIVTADGLRFEQLLADALRDRPRLTNPPDKLTVFQAVSTSAYENLKPAQIQRLRDFMTRLFKAWGIRTVQIIPV